MFDIEQAHDKVAAVLASKVDVDDGMSLLIDYCAEQAPWNGWNDLRKLDLKTDQLYLQQWLDQLFAHEPPTDNICAFWFGLFNPVIDGKSTCRLYAAGTETFDSSDDDYEWACNPAWFPDGRNAESQVLDAIYEQVNRANDAVSSYEYVLCLGYAGLVVKHFAATFPLQKWLGVKSSRAVAIGFDSGDGIFLGTFSNKGWKLNLP